MKTAKAPIRHRSFSYCKLLLCVLLACLFLYNPFQAISHNPGMGVCHPASYRATVASSEVEQFAPPTVDADALVLELDSVDWLMMHLTSNNGESRQTSAFLEEVAAPSQAGFSSSLWFRPPPAA